MCSLAYTAECDGFDGGYMVVFRYEMRQLRKNTIIWALCMGGLIFIMLPTYIGFTTSGDAMMADMIENNAIFDVLGVDTGFVLKPVGMFSFLNSFAMFAAAIHGMGMAFGSHTKEYSGRSAEFLLTKPISRGRVFVAKLAACAACAIAVSVVYITGAALALNTVEGTADWRTFALVALTLLLVELVFIVFGMLAGAFFPNTRTPTLISACVMLALFCLNTMAKKINAPLLGYLTPFAFFSPQRIAETGFYEWGVVIWYVLFGAGLTLAGYIKFKKSDVLFAG